MVRAVCKSFVGRPDLDLDVIGPKVFPLSLTGEDAMWFTELPYNSIFTRNQLRDVFLARYYPVSKKLNYKDRVLWHYQESQLVVLGIDSPHS